MSLRLLPTLGLLAVALAALPACKKKPDDTHPDTPAPKGNTGDNTNTQAKPYDLNHLRQLGEPLVNYTYVGGTGSLPSPIGVNNPGPNSKPLLSWRVYLLRTLNEEALFKQFKLDEPWDSPTNKALIEKMPKAYQSPNASAPAGQTYYKVFVGGGAAFATQKLVKWPFDFTDGTSNSILVVEADPPVTWTKPEDIPYDPAKPLPELKLNGSSRINILMADGSVRTVDLSKLSEKTLRAAITIAGGDLMEPDWAAQDPSPPPNMGPSNPSRPPTKYGSTKKQ